MLTKSQYLISSADRVRSNPSAVTAEFVCKPNPPLRNVVNSHVRMCVVNNGLINIDESSNTFLWNSAATSIPPSYYDQIELSRVLSDLLSTVSVPVVVDVLANGKLRIRCNNTFTISFVGYAGAATLLGFGTSVYSPTLLAGMYTLVSDNAINLPLYDYILVQSNKLGSRIRTSTGLNAYAMLLNYNNNYTSSLVYENYLNMEDVYNTEPTDLEEVDIRLVDGTGKILNLRGQNVAILMEFFTAR